MSRRGEDEHSIHREPHMQARIAPATCGRCGYELGGLPAGQMRCPECGALRQDLEATNIPGAAVGDHVRAEEVVEHGVWDEPALRAAGAAAPEGAATYARWLEERKARTSAVDGWMATLGTALAAGPWAVAGAIMAQFASGTAFLGVATLVVFGPLVEELMKIGAATFVVEKRPYWFRSRGQILIASAAGGLAFAAIENVMYLDVRFGEAPAGLAAFRWTVCTALHVGCSLIAGMGLARVWSEAMRNGARPDLTIGFPHLVAAMIVHGAYNGLMVVLEAGRFVF